MFFTLVTIWVHNPISFVAIIFAYFIGFFDIAESKKTCNNSVSFSFSFEQLSIKCSTQTKARSHVSSKCSSTSDGIDNYVCKDKHLGCNATTKTKNIGGTIMALDISHPHEHTKKVKRSRPTAATMVDDDDDMISTSNSISIIDPRFSRPPPSLQKTDQNAIIARPSFIPIRRAKRPPSLVAADTLDQYERRMVKK